MITLDTSGLLAVANRGDPDHRPAVGALQADPGPYLVPAGILAEVTYLMERRYGAAVLDACLAQLETGDLSFECGEADFARVRELVRRYEDLPLGAADASVIACAERNGGAVLTLDVRDFSVVAREGTIEVLP
jgi:predicted nucleic acid-binding protein